MRYALRFMLAAQGLLAFGLTGDAYIKMGMIFEAPIVATCVGTLALLVFATLSCAVPVIARTREG